MLQQRQWKEEISLKENTAGSKMDTDTTNMF